MCRLLLYILKNSIVILVLKVCTHEVKQRILTHSNQFKEKNQIPWICGDNINILSSIQCLFISPLELPSTDEILHSVRRNNTQNSITF